MSNDKNSTNITENLFGMLENDFQVKNTNYDVLVTITTADGKEDVSLRSDKFRSVLANRYRKKFGKIPSSAKINDCVLSYQGEVVEEKAKVKNSNRCDRGKDNSILIDCGDKSDTYLEISTDGMRVVEGMGSEYFFKHSRKGEIPIPDIENGDIDRIFKYCRVPEDMKNIFIAYLVSLFIGDIEHPCLVLNGEQGSGKTTMSTIIKALVDPVGDSRPSLFPKNDADLPLMFRENYLVAFDNLQTINARLSDKLCTIVTGITESRRKLYTNDEMMHFDLCQPIILNGIHDIVKREDMLSRCIVIEIQKSIDESGVACDKVSLMNEFMKDRPIIFGGIMKILMETLSEYEPNVDKLGNDIRMASFYDYGYYICEAWNTKGVQFVKEYAALVDNQLKIFRKNGALFDLIKTFAEIEGEWEGTMQELLDDIVECCSEDDETIPKTANRLSRELNKMRGDLFRSGVVIETSKTKNNSRYITLSYEGE